MNCSETILEPGVLNLPRTRLMLPDALIIAIWSFPPDKPRVHLFTREYFLSLGFNTDKVLTVSRQCDPRDTAY